MQFWTTERRGAIEIATFSNPPNNYLDTPVMNELDALIDTWKDPEIRVVIIQSRPEDSGYFTMYSIDELSGLAADPGLSRYAGAAGRGFKATFDKLLALPKIVIAAMNGTCLGGGFELPLSCDLRIGERGDHRYGNPEVRAGVVPGAGATQRISRLVGVAVALNWIVRGRIVAPEVAFELGLVHELVDDAPARALELAEEIALLPPKAVGNAKLAVYHGADANLQAGYEIENMKWTEVLQSDDAKVALGAIKATDPGARVAWFESDKTRDYPEYSGS